MAKKDKQENDPTLPTLPDGYFWRVGPKEGLDWVWGDGYRGYGVSLRQGRKRLCSSTVLDGVITDERVARAAQEVFDRRAANLREAATRTRLAGDYPPKTL